MNCCEKYPDCKCDIKIKQYHQKMHDLRLQEIAHENNKMCEEEDCHDCCGEHVGHELDDSEGGMCINCGYHPNW